MCGIAGIHRRTDAKVKGLNALISELFVQIENRGRDATGYVAIDDSGGVQIEKMCVPARTFIGKKRRIRHDARSVLLHTRFATTGTRDSVKDAHPQSSGDVYVTHNGTIWNDDQLFREWGMPRRASVDTEVIPALIDQVSGWEDIGGALELLQGGAAVAIANAAKPREMTLARVRDYPVVYVVAKDFVVWASTSKALIAAWKVAFGKVPKTDRIKSLGEGEMLMLKDGKVSTATFKVLKPHSYYSQQQPATKMMSVDEWLDMKDAEDKKKTAERILANKTTALLNSSSTTDEELADALDQFLSLQEEEDWAWDEDDMVETGVFARCDDCAGWSGMTSRFGDSILCIDCYEHARDDMFGEHVSAAAALASNVIPISAARKNAA